MEDGKSRMENGKGEEGKGIGGERGKGRSGDSGTVGL